MRIDATDLDVWVAVPGDFGFAERDIDGVPFVAVAYNDHHGKWDTKNLDNTTRWAFYMQGASTTWDDLADEHRMQVRTASCWKGHVKDYWRGFPYKSSVYYILEALLE